MMKHALLAGCAVLLAGCNAQAPDAGANQMNEPARAATDLAALEQQAGDRMVRVIITVRGEGTERDAALAEVAAALRQSGANSLAVIEGQPMLVVEAQPAQLRAAVATGRVASIATDMPAPTN